MSPRLMAAARAWITPLRLIVVFLFFATQQKMPGVHFCAERQASHYGVCPDSTHASNPDCRVPRTLLR